MSEIADKIQKALEYSNNGDPIRDVICGEAEWHDVLEHSVTQSQQLTALQEAARNLIAEAKSGYYSKGGHELTGYLAVLEALLQEQKE